MKLHLLERAIDLFIETELKADAIDWYFPHALVKQFQAIWAFPEEGTLKGRYDRCLQSEFSQRWWKRDTYRPKEIMLQLIEADPELAVIAWKDLSNDAANLEGRLSRFDYYCNELLQIHRQKNIRAVDSYHHQDAPILSLYLAGLFPDKYALYPGLNIFQSYCKAVGSPDIPVIDDLVRYMKVATIVDTFLRKNQTYERLIQFRDPAMHKVNVIPFQISYEVILFEGTRYQNQIG